MVSFVITMGDSHSHSHDDDDDDDDDDIVQPGKKPTGPRSRYYKCLRHSINSVENLMDEVQNHAEVAWIPNVLTIIWFFNKVPRSLR